MSGNSRNWSLKIDAARSINSNLKILCVGLANVDTVLVCKSFPIEDSDQRCIEQRVQVGGNAANNCTVLSALGVNCEFLGSLSNCHYTNYITQHFKTSGICFENCVYHSSDCGDRAIPNSTVIINDTNGSRTILHYSKNWPEIMVEGFKKLDLSQYSWVHFEGRNIGEVKAMVKWIDSWNIANPAKPLRVSVELEKPRVEVSELLSLGDVVVIGKDFALYRGCKTMDQALKYMVALVKPNATVIVPWGELGAVAQGPDGTVVRSPAFPPPKVLDTLGAGDTFCAATISALNYGQSLHDSITFGCQVAGAKVGMYGYEGLKTCSRN